MYRSMNSLHCPERGNEHVSHVTRHTGHIHLRDLAESCPCLEGEDGGLSVWDSFFVGGAEHVQHGCSLA